MRELKPCYQPSLGVCTVTRDPFYVEVYDTHNFEGMNRFGNSRQLGQVFPISEGRQFEVFIRGSEKGLGYLVAKLVDGSID